VLSTAADPEIDSLIYKDFLKTERRQYHTAVEDAVHGEFVITLRSASGTDRGNGAAKRSDQGRHGREAVCHIVLLECCH
jgi:hypothetical protein